MGHHRGDMARENGKKFLGSGRNIHGEPGNKEPGSHEIYEIYELKHIF